MKLFQERFVCLESVPLYLHPETNETETKKFG